MNKIGLNKITLMGRIVSDPITDKEFTLETKTISYFGNSERSEVCYTTIEPKDLPIKLRQFEHIYLEGKLANVSYKTSTGFKQTGLKVIATHIEKTNPWGQGIKRVA